MLFFLFVAFAFAETKEGTCGEGCTWKCVDGHLTYTANGTLPSEGTDLGECASNTVKSITFESGITKLASKFGDCAVQNITFKGDMEEVSNGAFRHTGSADTIIFEGKVTKITGAFDDSNVKTLIFKGDVTELGGGAFRHTGNAQTIKFEGKVGKITGGAFDSTTAKTIVFEKEVEELSGGAFRDAQQVETLKFEGDVKKVEGSSFENLPNVKTFEYNGNNSPSCNGNNFKNIPEGADVKVKGDFCGVDGSFGTFIMMICFILFFLF